MNAHTQKTPSQNHSPSAEIICKIANCENLELFPEIKPISCEIICFHLNTMQSNLRLHTHTTSFSNFPLIPWNWTSTKKQFGSPKYRNKKKYPTENQIELEDYPDFIMIFTQIHPNTSS